MVTYRTRKKYAKYISVYIMLKSVETTEYGLSCIIVKCGRTLHCSFNTLNHYIHCNIVGMFFSSSIANNILSVKILLFWMCFSIYLELNEFAK
jgi:hypothetical protein